MTDFRGAEELGVAVPSGWTYITRLNHGTTAAERERALSTNCFNYFSFPTSMLVADFLSDGGCTAITDVQWAALFRGDEAYGRNHGYYAVLDAARDVFERATPRPGTLARSIIVDDVNSTWMPTDEDLKNPPSGGFANGGVLQLSRPNFFILPSQRSAEFLLFRALSLALASASAAARRPFAVVSNGLSDTTEAHVLDNGFESVNIPMAPVPGGHFNGGIDISKLRKLVDQRGDSIAVVLLSLTNGRGPGFPVSMANVAEAAAIAHAKGIPVVFDAARYPVNLLEIMKHESGLSEKPLSALCVEMFAHCDAFMTGSKRKSNSGAFLCFRDRGLFHGKFSEAAKKDIGVVIKEAQILNYGNDSYGALSGRDLMAMAVGIAQSLDQEALEHDAAQASSLAAKLTSAGVKGVVPSAYAVFIDIDEFFDHVADPEELKGVGLVIELIRLYGIRCSEMGPHTFSAPGESPRTRPTPNFVRIAIPHGAYSEDHIAYAAAAIAELYRNRHRLPSVRVKEGEAHHRLQHFQTGLELVYPTAGKLLE